MIGINAGSGQRPFDPAEGWINLDAQPQEYDCVQASMDNMPFSDASVDIVVSHHTLEHMGCGEGDGFIEEARRVLKPHGSLLVFAPDLRSLAQRWLTRQLSTQIFMTNVFGAYQGNEHDRHKWGYDQESLREYLGKWEWTEFKSFDWREIPGAPIAQDWWVLGMECVL